MQLSLFDHVKNVYSETSSPLDNETLYARVAARAGITEGELNTRSPIGKSGAPRSKLKRAIRWHQQTMKSSGWIEKTGDRGVWKLTRNGKKQLTKVSAKYSIVAFSTDLGVAIWGNCTNAFKNLNEKISLVLTSPPYPLKQSRAYGNVNVDQYIDFICSSLEPMIKQLKPGGSVTINLSNDIFEHRSPARSLYLEKLTIALSERLGLSLMDRLIWNCPNKPPGPVQWCSKHEHRFQLNYGYEPILWFSNDPLKVLSNNNRVLIPHTEKHLKLIQSGGEKRSADYSDGAHRIRPGNYSNATPGRIPKNVITIPNTCHSQRQYKARARELNLPVHGAPMPLALAKFLIEFLTPLGALVAEPFGGSLTTALAAEELGRRWIATEIFWEYLCGGAARFNNAVVNPFFSTVAKM
ncbi:DNA methyltransferase [Microbulbifer epialgicus]|uniref:Methyltransferase n=1 Tax=Microbulbifer epialgicus TaxID=393907 RepID=A0ABV4NVD6_9GAMM